jgi:hypothetical protein
MPAASTSDDGFGARAPTPSEIGGSHGRPFQGDIGRAKALLFVVGAPGSSADAPEEVCPARGLHSL